ncbi:MAG: L-threonylcarbamoyladenylate synthase [Gammaproteobacteria bacterium]
MNPSFRQRLALRHLMSGVIAHPTDTIYGLACLASNPFAVNQLIQLKRRDSKKGLILLASDVSYVAPYIDSTFATDLIDGVQMAKNQPTTFLVPADSNTSTLLTGGGPLIAVRITDNALVQYFCESAGSALVSSSANVQGQEVATSLLQLQTYFNQGLSFALAPAQYNSQASTIINLLTGERIR